MRGLIILLLPLYAAAPLFAADRWELPLTIEAAVGCQHDLRSAAILERVAVPDSDGSILIDATRPVRWSGPPDAPPLDENGLLHTGYAAYDVSVPQAGTYALWVEFAASRGRTQFVEMVNRRRITAPHTAQNPDGPAPAQWVRRFRTSLRPGLNRVAIAEYGQPFSERPRLRRLALVPEEDGERPLQVKESEARRAAVEQATVETAAISVPGLRRVLRISGVPEGVEIACRVGDAPEWVPLPRQGLEAEGPIRFRFVLNQNAAAIGPLSVEIETEDGSLISLQSGHTEMLFERAGGGLFLTRNRLTGTVYAGGLEPQPLSAVDFKRSGQALWTRVDPQSVSQWRPKQEHSRGQWDLQMEQIVEQSTPPESVDVTEGLLKIRRSYEVEGLGRAEVTEIIAPEGNGAWRMAAEVEVDDESADVVSLTFPRIDRVTIGGSGLDDVQLRLQSYGHRIEQPGRQPLRSDTYSGAVVMNWTQIFDTLGSLYLGVHDRRGTTTRHGATASGPEGEAVSLFVQRLDDLQPGARTVWETQLALGNGGWHQGAERYRRWFQATHGQTDLPDWMRASDGWLNLQLENMPDFTFDDLPDHLTRARAAGLDWVQVWGQFGYDHGGPCCSAWYGPSPRFGGVDGFRRAATKIRDRGGRFGGYFHYDTVDRLPAHFDLFLGRFSSDAYPTDLPWDEQAMIHRLRTITDPAGDIPPLQPEVEELADWRQQIENHQHLHAEGKPAAPVQWWTDVWLPDPEWRDRMTEWIVDRYADRWNCNTAYIDVLGTGNALLSYDPRRNHNGDGGWGEGRLLMARELSERARQVDRDFGIAQEGLGDLPGLHAAKLVSGVYFGGRNVMRYTFPDRVLIHGMSNATTDTAAMDRWLETFSEAMRFDIVGNPSSLAMSLLTLVRTFTPELWQADFRDNRGVEADPRIVVRRLQCRAGRLRGSLLTVVNRGRATDAQVTVDETVAGGIGGAFLVDQQGTARELELVRSGDEVSFQAPAALAGLVFLAARDPGEASVWPVARLRRDAPSAVEVTLLNLTGRPQTGRCQLTTSGLTEPFQDRTDRAREMLPLLRERVAYDLPAFGTQTLVFPVATLERMQWSVPVDVTLEPEKGERSQRTVLVTPLMLDGSFEFLDGTETEGADGSRALRLPPSEAYQYIRKDLWLLPNRHYRLSMKARRTGFDARVSGSLLQISRAGGPSEDHFVRLDRSRANQWQTRQAEFTTPSDMTSVRVFFYNVQSPDTAWFDDVQITDLGPVEPEEP